jgi:hypothetical protein
VQGEVCPRTGVQRLQASEVADLCLYESGARGISKHSKEVALVGLLVVPDGAISMRSYRRRMKETYLRMHPECGSFFVMFVLPVLISLVSNWIAKWITNRKDMRAIRSQAFDALTESSPSLMDRLTSISTSPNEPKSV